MLHVTTERRISAMRHRTRQSDLACIEVAAARRGEMPLVRASRKRRSALRAEQVVFCLVEYGVERYWEVSDG